MNNTLYYAKYKVSLNSGSHRILKIFTDSIEVSAHVTNWAV